MTLVTLLTDFGTRDEYVGVVKGVILAAAPQTTIVDLSHAIAPQDVAGASRMLAAAFPYFPPATVHVAIVDPGVGSERGIVGVEAGGQRFLAPDNGLLTPVLDGQTVARVHRVTNRRLFRSPVSATFHGRDIFAPVAGHLARGGDLADLGPPADPAALQRTQLERPHRSPDGRRLDGVVTGVDRFGNLITNIGGQDLEAIADAGGGRLVIGIGRWRLQGLAPFYGHVPEGEPLAIIGSRGMLEIAVHRGNAAKNLGLERGQAVRVTWEAAP